MQKALSAASTLCVYGDALADGKYLFDQCCSACGYPFERPQQSVGVKCAIVQRCSAKSLYGRYPTRAVSKTYGVSPPFEHSPEPHVIAICCDGTTLYLPAVSAHAHSLKVPNEC